MKTLYNYWKFFFENKFSSDQEIFFFNDGGFAITKREQKYSKFAKYTAAISVALYSNNAEHIRDFDDAVVLKNGCICAAEKSCINVYFGNKHIYSISRMLDYNVKVFTNSLLIRTTDVSNHAVEQNVLYFIEPEASKISHLVLQDNVILRDVSVNKMLRVEIDGKKYLMSNKQEYLLLKDVVDFKFIANGGYIAVQMLNDRTTRQWVLYNPDNIRLCSSEFGSGMRSIGDKVCFENKLIVDPQNGNILGEYNGEKAIYGYVHIYENKVIYHASKRFFLTGSLPKCCYIDGIGQVLYYMHDGHFYLCPSISNKDNIAWAQLKHPNDKAWDYYLDRVLELML